MHLPCPCRHREAPWAACEPQHRKGGYVNSVTVRKTVHSNEMHTQRGMEVGTLRFRKRDPSSRPLYLSPLLHVLRLLQCYCSFHTAQSPAFTLSFPCFPRTKHLLSSAFQAEMSDLDPLFLYRWQTSMVHRAAATHLALEEQHVTQTVPIGLWENAESSICPFHSDRQKCHILSTYGNFTKGVLLQVQGMHHHPPPEPFHLSVWALHLAAFCQSLLPGDLLTKSTDSFLIRFKIMRYVRLRTQGLIIYLTFFLQ